MLHDEHGLALSPRRVTLSTVGIVPGLERLAREPLMPNLAISLHATTDEQRTALVPPNRKYRSPTILDACRRFPLKKRSRITFEYVLLAGVNDTPEDARRLARLLAGIKSKVNLIPLNAGAGHSVRAAVGRARRSLRADPRRPPPHRLGPQEPRPRHPRRVRSADRRRRHEEDRRRSRWRCCCRRRQPRRGGPSGPPAGTVTTTRATAPDSACAIRSIVLIRDPARPQALRTRAKAIRRQRVANLTQIRRDDAELGSDLADRVGERVDARGRAWRRSASRRRTR